MCKELVRKNIRLKDYNYSQLGEYFVTICTKDRENLLGMVVDEKMILSKAGEITEKCWLEIPNHFPNVGLDVHQIMPNHIHGVIRILGDDGRGVQLNAPTRKNKNYFSNISPKKNTLSVIIRTFKGAVKTICNQNNLDFFWQRSFYDHIIRTEKSYSNIYDYIQLNVGCWQEDLENSEFKTQLKEKEREEKLKKHYKDLFNF